MTGGHWNTAAPVPRYRRCERCEHWTRADRRCVKRDIEIGPHASCPAFLVRVTAERRRAAAEFVAAEVAAASAAVPAPSAERPRLDEIEHGDRRATHD